MSGISKISASGHFLYRELMFGEKEMAGSFLPAIRLFFTG